MRFIWMLGVVGCSPEEVAVEPWWTHGVAEPDTEELWTAQCPNHAHPEVRYFADRFPAECATILFVCPLGQTSFFDAGISRNCGCGCLPEEDGG